MTLKELQAQAKLLGIKNVKKFKKAELEAMLSSNPAPKSSGIQASDYVLLADLGSLDSNDLSHSLSAMGKGNARKVRKALFAKGHRRLAAVKAA